MSTTTTTTLHYLDEHGGCPVCGCGHVVCVEDGTAWLCDLHFADLLGTPEHAGITR